MNYSHQREKIEECVLNSCEHLTAEAIYDDVRKMLPNISLGTVYRNLNNLSKLGRIKKISMPNHCDRFDKTLREHYHIRCVKCDKLIDIDFNIDNESLSKIERDTDYKILSCNLVLDGICNMCKLERNEF